MKQEQSKNEHAVRAQNLFYAVTTYDNTANALNAATMATREKSDVDDVMSQWFEVPGIAEQLEGFYNRNGTRVRSDSKRFLMNDFFSAYESGEMDKAWQVMKQLQKQIK